MNFFQFLVDDMLFFHPIDLAAILKLLDTHWSELFSAHLKLYPGINYSHTNDRLIDQLPSSADLTPLDSELTYFSYDRTQTELDWNYPFDFCGSIYLLDRVVEVLEAIYASELKEKVKKPNSFEYVGNKVIKERGIADGVTRCICLNRPVMTVITVNKVQDVYETPVYGFKPEDGQEGDEDQCLEVMN